MGQEVEANQAFYKFCYKISFSDTCMNSGTVHKHEINIQ